MRVVVDVSEDNLQTEIELSDSYDMASELHKHVCDSNGPVHSKFRYFYTDGLILIDAQTVFARQYTTTLLFENHIMAVVFHLEGNGKLLSPGAKTPIETRLHTESHNIQVIGGGTLQLVFEPDTFNNAFILLLSKEFCFRVMPQEHNQYKDLLRAVENGINTELFTPSVLLSQEMKRIIENVRNCSRKGSFHRLCLEIKIAELLMLQFEQYQLLHTARPEKPILHEADMERIERAKNILDNNYMHPPTIKALASMVGINETKLKADFKRTYQRTIHEYTVSLRMRKAFELITHQNLLLKEVAMEVGYQKPSNFTKVFTEFYGVHPRDAAKASLQEEK